MNKWIWYACVAVALALLIIGVIEWNLVYIVLAFVLAVLLKKYSKDIPLPKAYQRAIKHNEELAEKKKNPEK